MEKPRKGIAAIILEGMKPEKSNESETKDSSDDMDEGMISAVEEMMAAFRKEDAKRAAMALKSFMDMCDCHEYDNQDEDK